MIRGIHQKHHVMQKNWVFKLRILLVLFSFLIINQLNAQLTINEVVVRNNGVLFDEDDACNAYVEIYNDFPFEVDLHDYYLSDQAAVLDKWRFPHQIMNSHEFVIVQLSNKNRENPLLHANFSLSLGENIFLIERNSNVFLLIDSLPFLDYRYNTAIQRYPDGGGTIQYAVPTPNLSNVAGEIVFPPTPITTLANGVHPIGTVFNLGGPLPIRYSLTGFEIEYAGQTYSSPLSVLSVASLPNVFSEIPTNPSLNFPVGDYSESRANNRGWVPPYGEVPKLFIVRAKSITPSGLYSEELVRTVFTETPHYLLPIVSIIIDSAGFFDDETGIYVFGNDPFGNYNQSSRRTERKATIQFFDSLGVFENEISMGMRIHGNGSRHSTQKSLRLYNRSDYDTTPFILPNGEPAVIAVVRSNGHRPDCVARDYLAHQFTQELPFAKTDPALVVVFINGEFWGVQDIRSNMIEEFLSSEYKIPLKNIAIANFRYIIESDQRTNLTEFEDLTLFAENNSLADQANFDYLADRIDLRTFMEVNCSQIFLGNTDYPINNNAWFNYENEIVSSKWRNNFFDLDAVFGGSCDTVYRSFNALSYYLQEDTFTWQKSTRLLRNFIKNPRFTDDFSTLMADLLNSTFKTGVLQEKFVTYQDNMNAIRLPHVTRWGYPSMSATLLERYAEVPTLGRWDLLYAGMDVFFRKRQATIFRHFMTQFAYTDTAHITVNNPAQERGFIQLNTLFISNELSGVDPTIYPWTGTYFQGVPVQLSAISKPGYRFLNWNNQLGTTAETAIFLSNDSTVTANFGPDMNAVEPHINEVLLLNTMGIYDDFGQHEGWIECYNANPYSISMANYFITNDLADKTKFRIKADETSILKANGYRLYYFSGAPKRGNDHLPFQLTNLGETIYLIAPDSISVIQAVSLPILLENESYGSFPNGTQTYTVFNAPTPNQNNNLSSVEEQLGISESDFNVFPNPASQHAYFSEVGTYAVFGINGLLLIPPTTTDRLNIQQLAVGSYLVKNRAGVCKQLIKM